MLEISHLILPISHLMLFNLTPHSSYLTPHSSNLTPHSSNLTPTYTIKPQLQTRNPKTYPKRSVLSLNLGERRTHPKAMTGCA